MKFSITSIIAASTLSAASAFAPSSSGASFARRSAIVAIGRDGNVDLSGNSWKPQSETMGVRFHPVALHCPRVVDMHRSMIVILDCDSFFGLQFDSSSLRYIIMYNTCAKYCNQSITTMSDCEIIILWKPQYLPTLFINLHDVNVARTTFSHINYYYPSIHPSTEMQQTTFRKHTHTHTHNMCMMHQPPTSYNILSDYSQPILAITSQVKDCESSKNIIT